jgi:hypothetical protein
VIAAAIVFIVCFGLGLGLFLGGRDDDEPDTEAAVDTSELPAEDDAPTDEAPDTTDPFGELPDAPGDTGDDPFGALPEDFLDNLPEGWEDLIPDDLLDDLSDLGNLDDLSDLEDLPGLGDVQVTILFESDARQQRIDAITAAFEDSPAIGYSQYLSSEDLSDLSGGAVPPGLDFDTLTAFGAGDDPEATRELACSFADDPAVQVVQIFGAEPCDQTT